MPYSSLSELVIQLEAKGKLKRVKEFVDPELEITEVTDRVFKNKDHATALLFENNGTDFPVLTNIFASDELLSLSLGIENPESVSQKVSEMLSLVTSKQAGILNKLKLLPKLASVAKWFPKSISGRGACQEVVHMDPDLGKIPVLKCWPYDGGKFITLPLVHTVSPISGMRNLGMYRMQIFGPNLTGMHWHRHKTGAQHYREYKDKNELMPVAVAIGGDPVYSYCATAPLPENVDEYLLAGFLRGKRVKMVKCLTIDLEVPCDVDFVIEGYVDPSEDLIWEGPFGDHTGFYSLADWYPKFHVTCITHRKNAIYPATIVGVPPMEDAFIAKLTEKIFISPIRFAMAPEMVDMHLPDEGVAHNLTIVSINKTYPGQAYKVGCALWGAGQMMFNKVMVVVDSNIDVHNPLDVAKAIAAHFNPLTDFFVAKGPLDVLDHASDKFAFGGKIILDATTKLCEEITLKYDNAQIETFPEIESVIGTINGLFSVNFSLMRSGIPIAIIGIEKSKGVIPKTIAHEFLSKLNGCMPSILLMVDKEMHIEDYSVVAWFTLGNIDSLRDCYRIVLNEGRSASLVIDGTRKFYESDRFLRQWPNVVVSSDKTITDVDAKWKKLNIGAFLASPSLRMNHLVHGNDAIVS